MTFKNYKCGACGKSFTSEQGAIQHATDAHRRSRRVPIFKLVKVVGSVDDEESYGERAVAASLAIALGEHTDDAWLLGDA